MHCVEPKFRGFIEEIKLYKSAKFRFETVHFSLFYEPISISFELGIGIAGVLLWLISCSDLVRQKMATLIAA